MTALLDDRLIFLEAEVATAQGAISLMAKRLEELGYVRHGYGEMVCERETVYPTGLVGASMAIALPHANPTLVIRPAVGVIVPRDPVPFSMMGAPDTKLEVRLVLPLVIKDSNKQLDLLKTMMRIIRDGALLERICASRDRAEIIRHLSAIDCA